MGRGLDAGYKELQLPLAEADALVLKRELEHALWMRICARFDFEQQER